MYLETKALCDLGDNSLSSKQSVLFIISIPCSTLLTVIGDIHFDHSTKKKIKLFAGCLHSRQPDIMCVCDPVLNCNLWNYADIN